MFPATISTRCFLQLYQLYSISTLSCLWNIFGIAALVLWTVFLLWLYNWTASQLCWAGFPALIHFVHPSTCLPMDKRFQSDCSLNHQGFPEYSSASLIGTPLLPNNCPLLESCPLERGRITWSLYLLSRTLECPFRQGWLDYKFSMPYIILAVFFNWDAPLTLVWIYRYSGPSFKTTHGTNKIWSCRYCRWS